MAKIDLDAVIGEFSDGKLTKREYEELMENIKNGRDCLGKDEYKGLCERLEGGTMNITKYQFVQIWERKLFEEIGFTRD